MLVCRIFLSPGGIGRPFEQSLRGKLEKLADAFPELTPAPDPLNHWVQFHGVDRRSVEHLEELARSNRYEYDIVVEEVPTDAELSTAPYVPLLCAGDSVDEGRDGEPLNSYKKLNCPACCMPDDHAIPNPYTVSARLVRRRKQDIYSADNGIFIASPRLLTILKEAAGGEIQYGQVRVDNEAGPTESHHWVRPLRSLGADCSSKVISTCAACGTPTEIRTRESGDKFRDARLALTHFPEVPCQIALSGSWFGKREQNRSLPLHRPVFVSGQLYTLLVTKGIKGLVRPPHVVVEGCASAP